MQAGQLFTPLVESVVASSAALVLSLQLQHLIDLIYSSSNDTFCFYNTIVIRLLNSFFFREKINIYMFAYLSKMQATRRLSTSVTSMFSSLAMNGMWILVYGLMSFINTCVRMFLKRSLNIHFIYEWKVFNANHLCFSMKSTLVLPSMCSRINVSSIMLWFFFKMDSNSPMSLFW